MLKETVQAKVSDPNNNIHRPHFKTPWQ